MFKHLNKNTRIELLKFAFSGGFATIIHWLLMALLINAGVAAITATAVGAFIGAIVNYILQRNIVFQSKKPHQITILPYIIVCIQVWISNLVFFYILNSTAKLSVVFAQGITTLFVAFMSYILYKKKVFNERQS